MTKIAIYCLDQDRASTSSIGIVNFTKQLLAAIASEPDPGFEVLILLSKANHLDLAPVNLPRWVNVEIVPGSFGSGLPRLWADHVLSRRLASRLGADAIHFPKGWIPIPRPRTRSVIATVYDTIPEYLNSHYPGYASLLRRTYFAWVKRYTVRNADRIITISEFSKGELKRLAKGIEPKISVVHPGPGIDIGDPHQSAKGESFLVIGSRLPHKATALTLRLLERYGKARNFLPTIVVVGLTEWLPSWGREPKDVTVKYVGRVPDTELLQYFRTSLVLLFLSEFEGFGLPPLESYELGIPVCYRDTSAVAEVMAGAPGGWDGASEESFIRALDQAVGMTQEEIEEQRSQLRARYSWPSVAQDTLAVYRSVLGDKRP